MELQEFLDKCIPSGLDFAEGEHEGEPGYFVHWAECPDKEEVVHCSLKAIAANDWETIRGFVVNGRDLVTYSRIVGYFSSHKNWNPSKIAELRDRRKGTYGVRQEA